MTMSSTKSLLFLVLTLAIFPLTVTSQENLTGYWQPQVALNYDVTANYSHNFSLANRNYIYRNSELQLEARQLDLVHFSNLKIGFNQSLGFGIQYRFRKLFEGDELNELRLTQQYNITRKYQNLRFGYRIRTEQRITASKTIHRFRNRLALDFPLQGEQLDVGEPYLVLSTESLLSVGKAMNPEFDQRITVNLGWLLTQNTKLQIGSEYRAENFAQNTENVFFLLTSLIVSL